MMHLRKGLDRIDARTTTDTRHDRSSLRPKRLLRRAPNTVVAILDGRQLEG